MSLPRDFVMPPTRLGEENFPAPLVLSLVMERALEFDQKTTHQFQDEALGDVDRFCPARKTGPELPLVQEE